MITRPSRSDHLPRPNTFTHFPSLFPLYSLYILILFMSRRKPGHLQSSSLVSIFVSCTIAHCRLWFLFYLFYISRAFFPQSGVGTGRSSLGEAWCGIGRSLLFVVNYVGPWKYCVLRSDRWIFHGEARSEDRDQAKMVRKRKKRLDGWIGSQKCFPRARFGGFEADERGVTACSDR